MTRKQTDFMKIAMDCARRAEAHGDVPIGAVVVQVVQGAGNEDTRSARAGRVVARGENRVQKNSDATMHAEIVAIRAASKKLGKKFLDDCEIYVTLEPCAMCATAISFARIGRIVFAARDEKGGGILHNARVYDTDRHLFRPRVSELPEHADESAKMLREFFKKRRK